MKKFLLMVGASALFACPPEPNGDCINASDCNDNNACTTDSCDASQCKNVATNIDDQVSCTADACDPATGQISHTAQDNLCADDGVACTVESCDAINDCQSTPDNGLCNANETCDVLNGCGGGTPSNPSITSVSPNNSLAGVATTNIIITGTDLLAGATVTFGGVTATCNAAGAPTQLSCDLPTTNTAPGRVDVVVTNADNQSATATNAWTNTGILNETNVAAEADFCALQFPFATTATAGQASEAIFGRIFEGGATDSTVGQAAPGINAELGFGPANSNPTQDTQWRFSTAVFNVETGLNNNDDEYQGTLTIPTAGTFLYTYRFSQDGGINFTYCDQANGNTGDGGSGSNGNLTFEANQLGTITVQ